MAQLLDTGNSWIDVFIGNSLLGAILPTILILIVLYVTTYRKGYIRRNKFESLTFADEMRGGWAMITASKNTALAGLGLGIFAGLQMWATGALREHYNIFNFGELMQKMGYTEGLSIQGTVFDPGYWYITTQEAQLGAWALDKVGVDVMDNIFFGLTNGIPSPWINAPLLMSVGIVVGAAILALTRHEFKWKIPNMETAIFALVGGALMGIGARLGMGCNVGAFFAAVTNGDMTGWIFLAGMLGGGLLGVKAFTMWIDRRTANDHDFDI